MKYFEKVAKKRDYIDISPMLSLDWDVAKVSVNEVYVAKHDDAFAATKLYITPRGRVVQFRHCHHTAPSHAVGGGFVFMLAPKASKNMYTYVEALASMSVPLSRRLYFFRTYESNKVCKLVEEYNKLT